MLDGGLPSLTRWSSRRRRSKLSQSGFWLDAITVGPGATSKGKVRGIESGSKEVGVRRREFLVGSVTAAGAALMAIHGFARGHARVNWEALRNLDLPQKFQASDTVTLGNTRIQTSRLAMGTGTVGSGHHSHQTALGIEGLSDLLLNGYDHGLRFFDTADSYGSHPHVAEALKHVPRD